MLNTVAVAVQVESGEVGAGGEAMFVDGMLEPRSSQLGIMLNSLILPDWVMRKARVEDNLGNN